MGSKRTASSELNHDNWNDEEEEEERGIFKQADQNTLKKRVIKTARRRNPPGATSTGESTGGTFAAFGGFKAATPILAGAGPTANAPGGGFDFLKNVSNGSSTSNGNGTGFSFAAPAKSDADAASAAAASPSFSFGNGGVAKEKASPSAGFSFGNGSAKSTTPTAGFSFGSSSANGNNGTSSGLFSFGNKDSSSTTNLEKKGDKEEKDDKTEGSKGSSLMDMFKPKPGSWKCPACDITNDVDKSKCVACTTPKPGDKPAATVAAAAPVLEIEPDKKLTVPKSDKWTCGTCMVPNDSSSNKCVCCDTPKLGAKIEKEESKDKPVNTGFSMAPGGGFKFDTSKSNSDASSSGFKFGATATTTTTESSSSLPTPTGFKFGASSNESSVSTTATPEKSSSNHNKYVQHLKALNRQVSKWIKSHVDTNPNIILSPIFKDYEKHLKEITEKYPPNTNSSVSESTEKKSITSSPENKPLLGAFFNKGNHTSPEKITFGSDKKSTSGFGSFSTSNTLTNDEKKTESTFSFGSGGEKSKTETTTSSTNQFSFGDKKDTNTSDQTTNKGFTFGASSVSTTETKSSGFTFGSSSSGQPSSTFTFGATSSSDKPSAPATKGFTFGSSSAFGSSSTGSSFFAGAAAAAAAAATNENAENANDDENDEPPKVEVKTVEEEGSLHSVRCKMYYKKEKDFVEKGLGMLHLKKADGNKTQMIIRADTNLGNIFLNILLNDKMSFNQRNNNLIFVTVPNPPIHGMAEGPVTLLIKLKNAALAEELNDKIKETLEKKE